MPFLEALSACLDYFPLSSTNLSCLVFAIEVPFYDDSNITTAQRGDKFDQLAPPYSQMSNPYPGHYRIAC